MNRINRNALALVVAGGLCGGVGFVQAGPCAGLQAAQRLDEGHWKHVHMHNAMASLQEARHELESAEDVFRGHRDEAIEHVDHAIKEIREGLHEQHDEAALPADLPAPRRLERFPHMHRAMEKLQDALTELNAADKIFGGHREEAIDHTGKAIAQLQDGIHDAER
jgi:hypothetical protein